MANPQHFQISQTRLYMHPIIGSVLRVINNNPQDVADNRNYMKLLIQTLQEISNSTETLSPVVSSSLAQPYHLRKQNLQTSQI